MREVFGRGRERGGGERLRGGKRWRSKRRRMKGDDNGNEGESLVRNHGQDLKGKYLNCVSFDGNV